MERVLKVGQRGPFPQAPAIVDARFNEAEHPAMTPAAAARWESIQVNTAPVVTLTLYEVMPDGGFTFGANLTRSGWRTFAVNPDGGRAYPLDL